MADFFGAAVSEGRSESSMVDSIMMPILHSAMNSAHDRVRSRDGVLQRLVEQSKFCDLAVMQLEACISCLQSAADDRGFHRETTAYRTLVSDLTEIRDRLLGRLKETECAIADKDKELQRLRNWFRNQKPRKEEEKEHSKEDRNAVEERKKADLERDKGGADCKSKSSQDCDQMGSEINSLKRTLDVAMFVMQNAISVSEARPFDQQFCWELEKDIMTTLFGGFVRDFQVSSREESMEVRDSWSPLGVSSLSGLMDDLLSLRADLQSLAASISKMDSKNLLVKKKGKGGKEELKDEAVNKVSMIIKAHESIINKNSDKFDVRCKETDELQRSVHGLINKLDSLGRWNDSFFSCVDKSLGNEKDAPLGMHDHDIKNSIANGVCLDLLQETVNTSTENGKIRENYREELNLQDVISGEIQSIFLRSVVKDFEQNIQDHELMSSITEVVHMDLLRETVKNEMHNFAEKMADQWNHGMENWTGDSCLREELYGQVLKEALKSITRKVGDLASQNKELKTICDTLIAGEITTHQSVEAEEFRVKNSIGNEVYRSTILHTLKDMHALLKRYEHYIHDGSFPENIMIKDQSVSVDAKGNNSFIELLDSLLCYVEEQNLVGPSSEDDMENSGNRIIQDSEYETLMMEENHREMEFNSSCDKFKAALEQLETSKMLLQDLVNEQESEMSNDDDDDDDDGGDDDDDDDDDERSLCHQREVPVEQLTEERKDHTLCLEETEGSKIDQLSGFASTVEEFIQLTANFESVLHQKFEFNFGRVERLKGQLVQLVRLISPIRRNESLYRQAFIRRCENLQKAETEVDILGDQVNTLLSLLERIYAIIQYHAPSLQQCSAVLNILTLIKKAMNGVTASY